LDRGDEIKNGVPIVNKNLDCDIVIVGLGPAGATLANLLGQAGIRVKIFEKEKDIYPLPRAIHFDGEIMRIFQSIGLKEAVTKISRAGLKGMHFINDKDETLLIRGGTTPNGPHGCANNFYFHQPELEAVLREGVLRFENVEIFVNHEVTHLENHPDGVELTVMDLESHQARSVSSSYVVGCDGARSFVRKTMGSAFDDLGLEQPWLVFDVLLNKDAPQLPDYTVQICDPKRPMTFCNVTANRRRFEIMLLPGDDKEEMIKHEHLWQMVSKWLQPKDAQIERLAFYTFHSVIAKGWRKNRLLIAGDAAHQTPPFLGQGMCAAIRDVANLSWKLEGLIKNRFNDTILDTYESERSPHVHAFIDLAVKLGSIIQTTDPLAAQVRDEQFKNKKTEVFEFPAPSLGRGLWRGEFAPMPHIFPQPLLRDGVLLDEKIGVSFAIIATQEILESISPTTRSLWDKHDVVVISAEQEGLKNCLDHFNAGAVFLRPDRYLLGVAKSATELESVSELLN
jgi:3-(3-hydroxy-phenyl)propionate hydroxylase